MLRVFLVLSLTSTLLGAQGLDLHLPTDNHNLFQHHPEEFFQYVNRNFEGIISKPWQGGCYGYVRNPMRIHGEVIHTRFHEGIDIKPLHRDKYGRPTDVIHSIAAGRVAYTNPVAGHSNYGRYVLIEHDWNHSPVYSLYAHLSKITCKAGDRVEAGSPIAIMGYTGVGITRIRAHCHLEIDMMMSNRFTQWAKGMINYHGNYNGLNLCGVNPALFFLEHRKNPQLTFSQFVASIPVYFKVLAPAHHGTPDFVKRYPWICHGQLNDSPSWEISFSATGLPVAFTPSEKQVKTAIITAIHPSEIPHQYLTRWLVKGIGNHATLDTKGEKLVKLLMGNF